MTIAPSRPLAAAALAALLALGGCASSADGAPTSATPTAGAAYTLVPKQTPPPFTASPRPVATPSPTAAATPSGPTTSAAGSNAGSTPPSSVAGAADTSHPDHVIGDGTPASCTSQAVVDAVAAGGVITFRCGPDPVTITMAATAKVRNDHPDVVLDGGGLVTLSGAGKRRILYQNTCDQAQVWTTSHCQDQDRPHLTLQHLTFANGNSTGDRTEGGGGGAVLVRGGRLTVVDTTFRDNTCDPTGPDLGGAALRVLSQYHGTAVQVIGSRFTGGSCSNGGAISSIGVSWEIRDTVMTGNEAIGNGANPARSGTPGGGSGGAVYADGNTFTISITGSTIEDNHAREGGGAVFFVSNDRTGSMSISGSTLRRNASDGFETIPGIFYLGAAAAPSVSRSTVG
ncbi:MAG: hypothetical protein KQH57_00975 [Actinomycetales bacterium]|nr:hypothetical protein [Actinomycetales bacterium]